MLIIPKPRTAERRIKIAAPKTVTPPPTLTIASVSDVSFDGPAGQVVVTFDVPAGASLNDPSGADPAQWTAVYNGTLYVGGSFQYDGGPVLTIYFSDYGAQEGENQLNYAADPSDISDSAGDWLGAVNGYLI